MTWRNGFFVLSVLAVVFCVVFSVSADTFREWEVFELSLTASNTYENSYVDGLPDGGDGLVAADFNGQSGAAEGKRYRIYGFWDGESNWKIRFAPPCAGTWSYVTSSKDPGLNGASGTINVIEWNESDKNYNPTRRGFIHVAQKGERAGRYFTYSDNTPFLWIGDTWWNWSKRGIKFESFKKMADDRHAKGFTVGQLFCAANGWGQHASLLDLKTFTVLDVEHMRSVEKMIQYANSVGITVWIHGWWSRKNINERIGEENILRWWKYLVHRLGAYNVIWTLAGEYNMHNYGGFSIDFWKKVGRTVRGQDPYERIISLHPTPPGWDGGADAPQWSTGKVLHREPWLDYNQSQPGHGKWRNEMIPGIVSADYKRTPAKPVVVTEPWYEFILGDPAGIDIRFGAWSAVLSGAAGHTYGGGHVWKAHVPESPQRADSWPMDLSFTVNTLDYPGALGMKHLASFFKPLTWWKMSPHPELVREYAEKYCLAVPGREYIVYARYGGSLRMDLNPSSENDTFTYKWYNPVTGEFARTGEIKGGGVPYLNAPGTKPYQDWVLYIKKKTD